ncbi:hypothetical protein G5V59_02865 [Nocardioides sp. W3-2-3]|uniref:hypothetical protein n=1 Tax=Nocardioides convexus TaxID=2712224 RepID=UPI0024187160|nr:hypothetical protein [Nocardioides convexus]NGZ99682.1 hypothetical protein [Nocardioides convexus]
MPGVSVNVAASEGPVFVRVTVVETVSPGCRAVAPVAAAPASPYLLMLEQVAVLVALDAVVQVAPPGPLSSSTTAPALSAVLPSLPMIAAVHDDSVPVTARVSSAAARAPLSASKPARRRVAGRSSEVLMHLSSAARSRT